MMRTPRALSYAAGLLALSLSINLGHAYCLKEPLEENVGGNWTTRTDIPVYLMAGPTDTLWNSMDIAEIEANLKAAVDTWWEEGQSNIRPFYAGRTTSTQSDGRILVRVTSDCTKPCSFDSFACELSRETSGHRVGSTVWVKDQSVCNQSFTTTPHFDNQTSAPMAIRRTFTHEIGHSLGILHHNFFETPQTCLVGAENPNWLVAMMSAPPYADNRLRFEDREALITLYGGLDRRLESFYSFDMLSWGYIGAASRTTASRPLSGGQALTWESLLGLPLAGVQAQLVLEDSFFGILDIWPDPSFPSGFTWQPVATSRGASDSDALVAWVVWGEDNTLWDCSFGRIAVTRDYNNWTILDAAPGLDLCSKGPPRATYDPRTSWYVVMWEDDEIQYVTYDLNGNVVYVGNQPNDDRFSVHTPALECGSVVGTENCLLVWDAVNAYGCLTFEHTHLTTFGQLDTTGPLFQDCWIQERGLGLIRFRRRFSYAANASARSQYALS